MSQTFTGSIEFCSINPIELVTDNQYVLLINPNCRDCYVQYKTNPKLLMRTTYSYFIQIKKPISFYFIDEIKGIQVFYEKGCITLQEYMPSFANNIRTGALRGYNTGVNALKKKNLIAGAGTNCCNTCGDTDCCNTCGTGVNNFPLQESIIEQEEEEDTITVCPFDHLLYIAYDTMETPITLNTMTNLNNLFFSKINYQNKNNNCIGDIHVTTFNSTDPRNFNGTYFTGGLTTEEGNLLGVYYFSLNLELDVLTSNSESNLDYTVNIYISCCSCPIYSRRFKFVNTTLFIGPVSFILNPSVISFGNIYFNIEIKTSNSIEVILMYNTISLQLLKYNSNYEPINNGCDLLTC